MKKEQNASWAKKTKKGKGRRLPPALPQASGPSGSHESLPGSLSPASPPLPSCLAAINPQIILTLIFSIQRKITHTRNKNSDYIITFFSRLASVRDLSLVEVSFTNCPIRFLASCLHSITGIRWRTSIFQENGGHESRETERESIQGLAVLPCVLGGPDGVDKTPESGDSGVDLEYSGGHGRDTSLGSRGGLGGALEILEAHLFFFFAGERDGEVGSALGGQQVVYGRLPAIKVTALQTEIWREKLVVTLLLGFIEATARDEDASIRSWEIW